MSTRAGSRSPLRILHIGSGFRPLRRGGLVAYTEDLAAAQARWGHEVTYLFSGRSYPFIRRPRLTRWARGGVKMLELINSPLYDHGRQPELELREPRVERLVERVIRELEPQVVHVQELAGLPSSVLEIARGRGAPVIMTLQDYFPLCSTFKLLDADNAVCLRRQIGTDCAAVTAGDRRDPALLFDATLRHDLQWRRPFRRLTAEQREEWTKKLARVLTRGFPGPERETPPPAAFQRRRDVNVARLNSTDRLIAMSRRVAEIYSSLGVDAERLRTLQLTLEHIERLQPRRLDARAPVTFATLGGGESEAKGSRVLLEAARSLGDLARAGNLRLLVFGFVNPDFASAAHDLDGVEIRGPYDPAGLDTLLDDVDVGIMPSIWEEAYGYAGIEFLAKGVPVIANAIGGMVDYVRDDETGWLNGSCSAEGLAEIMRGIVARPSQITDLNAKLRASHNSIVMPMAKHVAEMDAVYREAITSQREN